MKELLEELNKSSRVNLITLEGDSTDRVFKKNVIFNRIGLSKLAILDNRGNKIDEITIDSTLTKIDYNKHYTMFIVDNKYLLMLVAKE